MSALADTLERLIRGSGKLPYIGGLDVVTAQEIVAALRSEPDGDEVELAQSRVLTWLEIVTSGASDRLKHRRSIPIDDIETLARAAPRSKPPIAQDDGSLVLDNASVQRLMDYGLLHRLDDGWHVGPWPETNDRLTAIGSQSIAGDWDEIDDVIARLETSDPEAASYLKATDRELASQRKENERLQAALTAKGPQASYREDRSEYERNFVECGECGAVHDRRARCPTSQSIEGEVNYGSFGKYVPTKDEASHD